MRTSARALLPSRPRARANVQSTSSRSTPRSRPRAKRSSDEEEDEARERTESNDFFDATGRLEDVALIVGDVCALWTLTLCETVSAVSAKPSFPGWLAPVEISARDGAAFAARAMWALGCWVVAVRAQDVGSSEVTGTDDARVSVSIECGDLERVRGG